MFSIPFRRSKVVWNYFVSVEWTRIILGIWHILFYLVFLYFISWAFFFQTFWHSAFFDDMKISLIEWYYSLYARWFINNVELGLCKIWVKSPILKIRKKKQKRWRANHDYFRSGRGHPSPFPHEFSAVQKKSPYRLYNRYSGILSFFILQFLQP